MTVARLVTLLIICTPLTIILLALVLASATGDLPELPRPFHRTDPRPAPAAEPIGRHRLTPTTDRPRPRPRPRPAL